MNGSKHFWITTVVYVAILAIPIRAGSDTKVAAITIPSADVTLSFIQPGRIEEIYIKEGDAVKVGQVLVQQDDAVDQIRLAQLEADSKNLTNIEAGKASLAQKKVDLQKIERAALLNAATALEVEHAKLDVKIAELSLDVAKFEHEQAVRKYNEAKVLIDNMILKSPIEGSIEKVEVETGESINALESVVRVIRINPLWIDVPVPLESTLALKKNVAAKVNFPSPSTMSAQGKIIFIAAIADAGSGTLRVRIEVPNEMKRPAGEHVTVTFPSSKGKRNNIEQ